MPALPGYFARVPEGINLRDKLVVVVGVGTVGSPIAEKLARSTVGRLRFIDDDSLERQNLARHVLPKEYAEPVAWNKAEGLAVYLAEQVEGLRTEAVPCKVDASVSDGLLDQWLADADLIVAATDDRVAQRRVGQRALALGVLAIFPALFIDGGGEVVVQLDDAWPCFSCWDEFRLNTEQLRGADALDVSGEPVVHTSVRLAIGLLDPDSAYQVMIMRGTGEPPNQAFVLDRAATLWSGQIRLRSNCPVCRGGPTSIPVGIRPVPPRRPPSRPRPVHLQPERLPEALPPQPESFGRFMLLLLATLVPLGAIGAALATQGEINNPSGGVVLLGICCVVGFWVGVFATAKAFFRLPGEARGVIVVLVIVALVILGVANEK